MGFWEQFESEVSEFKSKTAGMEESKVSTKSTFSKVTPLFLGAGLDPRPDKTFEQHKSTLRWWGFVKGGEEHLIAHSSNCLSKYVVMPCMQGIQWLKKYLCKSSVGIRNSVTPKYLYETSVTALIRIWHLDERNSGPTSSWGLVSSYNCTTLYTILISVGLTS